MDIGKAKLAIVAILASGVLWGIISIFIRALSGYGYSLMQIVFTRMLFATVILGIIILIKDSSLFRFKLRDIWMFIGSGILSLFMYNCCYFYTVTQGYTSVGVVLMYTSPIFIVLLSAILFKERIDARKIVALIITVAGCTMVSGFIGSTYSVPPMIVILGLCAGLTYGMYTIFNKFALAKYSAITATFYSFVFALLAMAPFADVVDLAFKASQQPLSIVWGAGIGVICTIAPYFLYNWALTLVESGKAGIMASTEPLVGAMLGMLAYGESHEPIKVIGIACIICAIIVLNAPSTKQRANG